MEKPHYLLYEKDTLTLKGVVKVVEVSVREAQFKLAQNTVVIKGSGLNIAKLDKEQGIVVLEIETLSSITYKQGNVGLKGLFK